VGESLPRPALYYSYWSFDFKPLRVAIVYIGVWILIPALMSYGLGFQALTAYRISAVAAVLHVLALAFLTVRFPDIFLQIRRDASRHKFDRRTAARSTPDDDSVLERLRDIMKLERQYREPRVSLVGLSAQLAIGTKNPRAPKLKADTFARTAAQAVF